MSKFYLASESASVVSTPAYERSISSGADDEDDDDIDTLPYPGELLRSDFLAPDFDPQAYLSTLRNRHQTLEDLRSDLRQRSQLLNQELLDLVNGNYEEFLSLGADLRGGEEKVEGVRVGLLGFQRDIEGIKKTVKDRADEVGALLQDRKAIRRDVVLGRNLLEVEHRLVELERRLGIASDTNDADDERFLDEDEDYDDNDDNDEAGEVDNGGNNVPAQSKQIKRLQSLSSQYQLLYRLVDRIGLAHPLLALLEPRLHDVKDTILLDLASELRSARDKKDSSAVMAVIILFGHLKAEANSVRILKGG